jgi:putative effector of murein hydrolase
VFAITFSGFILVILVALLIAVPSTIIIVCSYNKRMKQKKLLETLLQTDNVSFARELLEKSTTGTENNSNA